MLTHHKSKFSRKEPSNHGVVQCDVSLMYQVLMTLLCTQQDRILLPPTTLIDQLLLTPLISVEMALPLLCSMMLPPLHSASISLDILKVSPVTVALDQFSNVYFLWITQILWMSLDALLCLNLHLKQTMMN